MNAVSALADAHDQGAGEPLSLRVLSGRSQGAEHRLPPGRNLAIGHSFENDIVLRDRTTKGCSFRLATCGKRPVLEVLAGQVTLLGREMGAGERVALEPYLPVKIGDFHFAIGGDDHGRWEEAGEAARDMVPVVAHETDDLPATDLGERLALRSQPARSQLAKVRWSPAKLGLVGAAFLAVAGGAFFGTSVLGTKSDDPAEIELALRDQGFRTVSVGRAADTGAFAVTGLVTDERALAQLREWVAVEHPSLFVGVDTLSEAAETATDLLAAQKVDARAVPEGASGLLIEGPFLPKDRQTELTALVQQDLPHVRTVTFRPDPNRGDSDLTYFFNAPGYGAASFVAGDPGYLVTEDGTRWFVGASLPTGHKIVEIGEGRVTVERNGLRDTLAM
ncbi:MAG: hypothetical protein AAGL68_09240 [Pseudomonadota bacterium]